MIEQTRQGSVCILATTDPLTQEFAESLSAAVDACLQSGPPRIVIDLEAAPLIDGRGLEVLLDAGDRCRERGGDLLIAGANPLCQDILRITGVSDRIAAYDDTLQAARSFPQ